MAEERCPVCAATVSGECAECRSFVERGMEIVRGILNRKTREVQREMRESPVCGKCGHSRAAHFGDGPCTERLMPLNLRDCYCPCGSYGAWVPAARAEQG